MLQRYAVIGAGWAGCAAAVTLAAAGHTPTLFEANRVLGGRARRVELDGKTLDNGQHILLGAYHASLTMMRMLGIATDAALLRLPLQMRYPKHSGALDFCAPRWPAPLHLLIAVWRASGITRTEKCALVRFFSAMRARNWHLDDDCSVLDLLARHHQSPGLLQQLWRPLCLAALNTEPARASAQVLLAVLRDSLGAHRSASDMLLPRIDLSALLPQRAADFIEQHGGQVASGVAIKRIVRAADDSHWLLHFNDRQRPPEACERIIIATAPQQAAKLLDGLADATTLDTLRAFTYETISTCYLQYAPGLQLPAPFFALLDDAANPGHYVFDRGQLDPAQAGLLAIVISAAAPTHDTLCIDLAQQLAKAFQRPALATPLWSRVITEKRATFACTPGLRRPGHLSGADGIVLAGDYTASDYPATLEAAVRSGIAAARWPQ